MFWYRMRQQMHYEDKCRSLIPKRKSESPSFRDAAFSYPKQFGVVCPKEKVTVPKRPQIKLGTVDLDQGSPNYGLRRYFVNNEKVIHSIYEKLLDFVERDIFRNNHIT